MKSHRCCLMVFTMLALLAVSDAEEKRRAGQEKQIEIAPGVKMTFVWCPPGRFLMGDAAAQPWPVAFRRPRELICLDPPP